MYIKLVMTPYGTYDCLPASSVEMAILGYFFTDDVGHGGRPFFRDWAVQSVDGDTVSGNCTRLEKEKNNILLWDLHADESVPMKVRMSEEQFVNLFDEWQEKVVKTEPQEVIIKYEHGLFWIETSNE